MPLLTDEIMENTVQVHPHVFTVGTSDQAFMFRVICLLSS
jgi:hypothetical protein